MALQVSTSSAPKLLRFFTERTALSRYLEAEWIHFTHFGIILLVTHYKTESVHFLGLMISATKYYDGFGFEIVTWA